MLLLAAILPPRRRADVDDAISAPRGCQLRRRYVGRTLAARSAKRRALAGRCPFDYDDAGAGMMARKAHKTRRGTKHGADVPAALKPRGLGVAIGLFLLAFALRLLFWQATADAEWPYSAYYKGDAAVWLSYAKALETGQPFELGLPLRPPAAGYLISWLWDGTAAGVASLRLTWCLLGALVVPLIYGAVRRSFGLWTAAIAGLIAAGSTGLMVLSTSLNNEMPYLVLVAASFYLWVPVRVRATAPVLALWGLVHALACLTRVEHALYFALLTIFLAFAWRRSQDGKSVRLPRGRQVIISRLALVASSFVLALLPWHLEAWEEVRRFNEEPARVNAATEAALRQVEAALAGLAWDEDALAERRRMPGFIRRTAANFVAATVLVRGGDRVSAADFQILEEGLGYLPRPLASRPFVALYGELNFYLANRPDAGGGFDRSPLEEPPPLAGGASRYPRPLIAGLPPPDLAMTYPAHLEIVNRGYALAGRWIAGHPGDFARLAGRKLAISSAGATMGLGGYNLPLGLSGVRRRVDLVVPESGTGSVAWSFALLAAALWGLVRGLRRDAAALVPWLAFLTSKLVVVVAFFGYARQGASVIPVLALLIALAAGEPSPESRRRWTRAMVGAALILLAIEGGRFLSQPTLTLDGRQAGESDPWPVDRHEERRLKIG